MINNMKIIFTENIKSEKNNHIRKGVIYIVNIWNEKNPEYRQHNPGSAKSSVYNCLMLDEEEDDQNSRALSPKRFKEYLRQGICKIIEE